MITRYEPTDDKKADAARSDSATVRNLQQTVDDLRSKLDAVVIGRSDEVGARSVRNLPGVHVISADQLNTYDVLVSDDVIFTQGAFDAFVAGPSTGKGAKAVATETEAATTTPEEAAL